MTPHGVHPSAGTGHAESSTSHIERCLPRQAKPMQVNLPLPQTHAYCRLDQFLGFEKLQK